MAECNNKGGTINWSYTLKQDPTVNRYVRKGLNINATYVDKLSYWSWA